MMLRRITAALHPLLDATAHSSSDAKCRRLHRSASLAVHHSRLRELRDSFPFVCSMQYAAPFKHLATLHDWHCLYPLRHAIRGSAPPQLDAWLACLQFGVLLVGWRHTFAALLHGVNAENVGISRHINSPQCGAPLFSTGVDSV